MDFCFSLGGGKREIREGGFSAVPASRPPSAVRHGEITQVNICSYEQMFTCDLFDGAKIPIHAEPVHHRC